MHGVIEDGCGIRMTLAIMSTCTIHGFRIHPAPRMGVVSDEVIGNHVSAGMVSGGILHQG